MTNLIHPKERTYLTISLIISILIYFLMVISLIGLFYIIGGAIVCLIIQGLFIGNLRGNGIQISDKQFPEVYQLAQRIATEMNLDTLPPIYIIQADGMLNAFATRFLGRNFVVVYSDIFELAYEQGEDALEFILCHEFAHIKRNHLKWRWILIPSTFIPFLSQAYSRACEYSCDRMAAYYHPTGAENGLLVLSAGKKLYKNVNIDDFIAQSSRETGLWVWLAEMLSSHPALPHRLKAIKEIPAVITGTTTINGSAQ